MDSRHYGVNRTPTNEKETMDHASFRGKFLGDPKPGPDDCETYEISLTVAVATVIVKIVIDTKQTFLKKFLTESFMWSESDNCIVERYMLKKVARLRYQALY